MDELPQKEQSSFFSMLKPVQAFWLGVGTTFVGLCAVGFFVLLSLMLHGGLPQWGTPAQPATPPAAAQPTADNGQQPPQQPPAPSGPVNVSVGHLPVKGNANAPVTIVEFADFRCPFCERFFTATEGQILKDYVNTGKAKYAFRHFAFLGQQSIWASEAAECANDQGKFWQFHDWLYQHQAPESDLAYYAKDKLVGYAKGLGMNEKKFMDCLNKDQHTADVQKDLTEGEAAGVTGTPTIFVNGIALVGAQPYDAVKAAIEQALAKK